MKIKTLKLTEKYLLQGSKEKIFAKIHCDTGRVTLTTKNKNDRFMFCKSDPERIKRLAQMFLKVSDLIK